MDRTRYADSVRIQVSGPSFLLPKPRTELGRLSMTWLHFLNVNCELKLDSGSNFYICTSTYSASSSDGWTASLNDSLKDFINKFARKRNKYCVRLVMGPNPAINKPSAAGSAAAASTSSPTPNSRMWKKYPPAVKRFASSVPLTADQIFAAAEDIASSPSSPPRKSCSPPPSFSIPTQGSFIQPIISAQQQEMLQTALNGNGKTSGGKKGGCGRKAITTRKAKREISLRVGAGDTPHNNSPSSEPSPPKLRRFDELEGGGGPASIANSTEPQPGPSSGLYIEGPSTAACAMPASSSCSRTNGRKKRWTKRFAEDDMIIPVITSVVGSDGTTGSVKVEPILVVDLEEEEQEEERNGAVPVAVGYDKEQEIWNTLGIEEDDEEEEDVVTEERELRRSGTENIREEMERRLDKFDDGMLRKIQKEIRRLGREDNWQRNVRRMPLGCYMLLQLFKDELEDEGARQRRSHQSQ